MLAGIPNAPSSYSPDTNEELAAQRVKQVLRTLRGISSSQRRMPWSAFGKAPEHCHIIRHATESSTKIFECKQMLLAQPVFFYYSFL